jgi:two-component system, cell cycle response regulator
MDEKRSNSHKILIVDDTPRNIQVVAGILQKEGYGLFFATDGEKALDLGRRNSFDLVLMDVMMPEMDGFEACSRLKKMQNYRDVPVIFLTARTDGESILKGFEVGGVDYVMKPFNQNELLSRVKAHLRIRSLTRELIETNTVLEHRMDIVDRYVMMLTVDSDRRITFASSAFCSSTGCIREELIGASLEDLIRQGGKCGVLKDVSELVREKKHYRGELQGTTHEGKEYWFGVNVFYLTGQIESSECKIIMEDITDKKLVERLSITDDLTGLYNRRHFHKVFNDEISRSMRNHNIFVFGMIDVDYFKLYNDIYGHVKGDSVLKSVADVMRGNLKRSGDFCFRLGGEEFGIIYSVKSLEDADEVGESVRRSVEDLHIEHSSNKTSPYVTVSMGLCLTDFRNPAPGRTSADELYERADEALYSAKHAGRNRVATFNWNQSAVCCSSSADG